MTYEPMPCHVLLFLNIPPTRWPPAWSQKQFFKALPPHPTISCSHKMIYNSGEVMSTDNSFQTIPHDVMLLQPSQHRRHTSRQQAHKKSFLAVSHNEWTYCCVKRILWIYKGYFPKFSQNKKKNTPQSGWLFDKYVSYTKIGFRPSLWWECFLIAVSKNAISPKRLPLAYVSCVSKSTFRQILWDGWSRNVQSKNTTSPKRLTSIYVSCLPKSTFRPILWGKCFGNV